MSQNGFRFLGFRRGNKEDHDLASMIRYWDAIFSVSIQINECHTRVYQIDYIDPGAPVVHSPQLYEKYALYYLHIINRFVYKWSLFIYIAILFSNFNNVMIVMKVIMIMVLFDHKKIFPVYINIAQRETSPCLTVQRCSDSLRWFCQE